MLLKRHTAPQAAEVAARIKGWARARFGDGEEAWMVTEEACRRTDGPGRQTMLVLLHPAASLAFRIARPMADVAQADIDALGHSAAALAAEACC